MDAVKLVRYTHAARRRYLKTLSELPWDDVVKDRGASFPSIRDIFLHVLNAEDRFINYVILGKSEKWASQDYGKFTNIRQIEERVDEVEKKVDAYLATLTERELNRKVAIPWRKEPPLLLRVEDILVNTAVEDASHMGELIAIMWQLDKQPPYSKLVRLHRAAPKHHYQERKGNPQARTLSNNFHIFPIMKTVHEKPFLETDSSNR